MNCIVIDDEPFAQETLASHIEKIPELHLVGVFSNALDATAAIGTNKIDIVFCDIQMPDLSGISFLRSLKNPPFFVFVTGDPNYAIESFELQVLDYILKPFSLERVLKSVNKAKVLMDHDKTKLADRKYLIIKDRSSNVIMPYDEIFYVKSDKDYVRIVTMEKDYIIWKRISDMEESLAPAGQFLRVQKSYIVNLDFAKKITGNIIKMKGNIEDIPIGGQYRDELFKRLGIPIKD